MTVNQAIELALVHHRNGNLAAAEAVYRQILARLPEHAVAMHYLGVLVNQLGRPEEAVGLIVRSIELFPDQPGYHNNLGEVYRGMRRFEQAEAAFHKALALEPTGAAQHGNLGLLYLDQGRLDEAVATLEAALQRQPDDANTLNNLASALEQLGNLDRAFELLGRALKINPGLDAVYTNLSSVLAAAGRLDEALTAANEATRLSPDDSLAHLRRANALLKAGKLDEGWPELEWRFRQDPRLVRQFPQPRWNGQPLANGGTIFLYGDQGICDSIQLLRYAAMVKQRGNARVVLECRPELQRIMQTARDVDEVVTTVQGLPTFDAHRPLESLPGIFQTTLESIPAEIPYLKPDEAAIERWRERVSAAAGGRLKVGLAWAEDWRHQPIRNRFGSCRLDDLSALAGVPGVAFVSLQLGDVANQSSRPPAGMQLIDLTSQVIDLADLAAMMMNLDLIISVDSAPAHLAAAMGKPVWTLLPLSAHYQWMCQREDSPWYPGMRLFRADRFGDWSGVAQNVAGALRHRVTGS